MAYVKEIYVERCRECGLKATHEVYNRHNSLVGYACRRHAQPWADKLTGRELAQ